MDIGTITTTAAHLYGANKAQPKRAAEKKSGISPREEVVQFSIEGKQANDKTELEKMVDATPEIRIELVEELKAKIKSNDYPIENKLDETVRRLIQNSPMSDVA